MQRWKSIFQESSNKKVDKIFYSIKNSLEDAESQGVKITKKIIVDSVKEYNELNSKEKENMISSLLNIFK